MQDCASRAGMWRTSGRCVEKSPGGCSAARAVSSRPSATDSSRVRASPVAHSAWMRAWISGMVALGFPSEDVCDGLGDHRLAGRPCGTRETCPLARAGGRHDRVRGVAIVSRECRQICPLEQRFDRHRHQYVIAQTRARHAVVGKCLFGTAFQGHTHGFRPRRPPLGQPPRVSGSARPLTGPAPALRVPPAERSAPVRAATGL
jgi:hypothetical protein